MSFSDPSCTSTPEKQQAASDGVAQEKTPRKSAVNICRVCGHDFTRDRKYSLFGRAVDLVAFSRVLGALPSQGDGLPDGICRKCKSSVEAIDSKLGLREEMIRSLKEVCASVSRRSKRMSTSSLSPQSTCSTSGDVQRQPRSLKPAADAAKCLFLDAVPIAPAPHRPAAVSALLVSGSASSGFRRRMVSDSSLVPVAEAASRGEIAGVINHLWRIPEAKDRLVEDFLNIVDGEMKSLCSPHDGSLLRKTGAEQLVSFSIDSVADELSQRATTLTQVLCTAARDISGRIQSTLFVSLILSMLCKKRNRYMSAFQYVLSLILYSSGAVKQTFSRLSPLNLVVSHPSLLSKLDELSVGFDGAVMTRKSESVTQESVSYQVIGDNIDLRVKVKTPGLERQDQSIHWFNTMAVRNRVSGEHLPDDGPQADVRHLSNDAFFLSHIEETSIRHEFAILVSRILVCRMQSLQTFGNHTVRHMPHQYSGYMRAKSEVIPLGVIQKNENVTEDMVAILTYLQKYVPDSGQPLFVGGDQLTVERARNSCLAVSDSTHAPTSWLGLPKLGGRGLFWKAAQVQISCSNTGPRFTFQLVNEM